jgi:drug/metabolite transporter (DMT)-like permease
MRQETNVKIQSLGLALAGFSCLSLGDAVVKSLHGSFPAPAISALRYVFGALGLGIALLIRDGPGGFVCPMPRIQILRAAAVSLSTFCFFIAIFAMPLATATAVQFTTPMITAVISAMYLKERAPRAVWVAIALAFTGVLIVLRPEVSALGISIIFPLLSALGLSLLMIFNRTASGSASLLTLQFLVALFACPILLVATALLHFFGPAAFHINTLNASIILRCAIVAVTGTVSHFLIFMATQRTSAAVIAPMLYVQLLIAVFIGWQFYGDPPDAMTIGGAAFVILGGLYLWRSERQT